jgi:hypothetical protein
LQKEYGYSRYNGQWQNDMRHGEGIMTFADGLHIFHGQFENNLRTGTARMYAMWQPPKQKKRRESHQQSAGRVSTLSSSSGGQSTIFGARSSVMTKMASFAGLIDPDEELYADRAGTHTRASSSTSRFSRGKTATSFRAAADAATASTESTASAADESRPSVPSLSIEDVQAGGKKKKRGGFLSGRSRRGTESVETEETSDSDIATGRKKNKKNKKDKNNNKRSNKRHSNESEEEEEELINYPVPPGFEDFVPAGHQLLVVYNGHFKNDFPDATKYPAWVRLTELGKKGRFYYGNMSSEGKLHGHGMLYSSSAGEDPEFVACVESGTPYTKEHPVCKKCPGVMCCHDGIQTLKYLCYSGQWKDNVPNGAAVQHFPGEIRGGVYYGQFVNGKRDGRGTWRTKDGKWSFGPLTEKVSVKNWHNDVMHGAGVVEDQDNIYENVIYHHGKCLMPFTEYGPPVTKFEQTRGFRPFFQNMHYNKMEKKNKVNTSNYGVLGGKKYNLISLDIANQTNIEKVLNHVDVRALRVDHTEGARMAIEDSKGHKLMREPTEEEVIDEDVYLTGGTGHENMPINGYYFKVTRSFGHVLYKSVKKVIINKGYKKDEMMEYHIRYLYKDDISQSWNVQPKALSMPPHASPGTIRSGDDAGENVADVPEWKVWYPPKRKQLLPNDIILKDEEREQGKKDVDIIKARGVLGFMVRNTGVQGFTDVLFVRYAEEFYRRPVYETQDGKLWMYWMKERGSHAEGMNYVHDNKGQAQDAEEFFQDQGYWTIAEKLGESPDEPTRRLYAYCKDNAVSPNQIARDSLWLTQQPGGAYEEVPDMWTELMLRSNGEYSDDDEDDDDEYEEEEGEGVEDEEASPREDPGPAAVADTPLTQATPADPVAG